MKDRFKGVKLGFHKFINPDPEVHLQLDQFAKELGIDKIVGLVQSASSQVARDFKTTETIQTEKGEVYDVSTRTFTIPIKTSIGREILAIKGDPRLGNYVAQEKRSLETNLQVSLSTSSLSPDITKVDIQTQTYHPSGKVKGALEKVLNNSGRMYFNNSGESNRLEVLKKISDLLDNLDKK